MKLLCKADIICKLESRRRFSFVKINHGLWERLVNLEKLQFGGIVNPDELERRTGQRPDGEDGGYLGDLRAALARVRDLGEDSYFAASPYSWPACRRIEGTPLAGLEDVNELIGRHVPPQVLNADGLIWKTAVYEGWLSTVIQRLRSLPVVIVGPHWLRNFGDFAGFDDFGFLEIHPSRARDRWRDTCTRLQELCKDLDRPVILLSAGHVSPLIVGEMFDKLPDSTFLDMGGSLDICHIPTLAHRNWALVRRKDVSATIEAIHPGWPDDQRAFTEGTSQHQRRDIWSRFKYGFEPAVAETLAVTTRRSNASESDRADLEAESVPFVEPKTPDWARIAEICALSQRERRWANFGPVAAGLAAVLQTMMAIPEDREVIPASSATTALHAVLGAHASRAGRPLVWAVSAFGFPSTIVGPLAQNVLVVDCDRSGFLDLERLSELELDSWDGMIVTNVFGDAGDFCRYQAFCSERGKHLVIDSALAFDGVRAHTVRADEVISFHHTKPWGFGEGGCAVVSRDLAQSVRNFLNFGFGTGSAFLRFATNGKISDLAAAAILERLERMPSWAIFYRMQHNRVLRHAQRAGLALLGQPASHALRGHIAILARRPIALASISKIRFDVQKYYRPLARNCPVAADLYGRILNVPCHPAMAAVPSDELDRFFAEIAAEVPA